MVNHPVHEAVLAFLQQPEEEGFEPLALAVFAHQYETIPAYRSVCDRHGASPATVRDWRSIPPVPALAFKHLELACGPVQKVFRSSGTSQGTEVRSRHALPDLRLYHASAVAGLRRHLFPDLAQIRIASLVPSAAVWPDSSLAQMISWAIETFGSPDSGWFAAADRFDFDGFVDQLHRSERDGEPLAILTTTSALLHFLDHARDRDLAFRLPHGSRLMDTGGDKGAPRRLSRAGLHHAIWNAFAIPGYLVVNEYGMSELSSQYYDNVLRDRVAGTFSHRAKVGPPWLRTRFLDPATLEDVPDGEPGLICHVDLANAGTALSILTEDLGRRTSHGFEVLGRAPGAEARGCSLRLAEFLEIREPIEAGTGEVAPGRGREGLA